MHQGNGPLILFDVEIILTYDNISVNVANSIFALRIPLNSVRNGIEIIK